MIIVGCGVIALVLSVVVVIGRFERAEMERQLHSLSANEMTSLHALILNVMAKRPEDGDNIGIQVFNNWFDSRNIHYPGKVWSAWGPQVTAYMAETEPQRAPKVPVDDVDREAFATKQPVGRQLDGAYRYAYPIVLGVTDGANQEVCFGCHAAMGMQSGDVIAVLSSSLSTAESEAKLHRILLFLGIGGLVATVVAVLGVRWSLKSVITDPIRDMTGRMGQLAAGDVSVDVPALERADEVGDIARAVQVFKENTIAKRGMEEDARQAAAAREARMHRLENLIHGFETAVAAVLENVAQSADRMAQTARRMVHSADSAAERAQSVSQHASDANQNVRMVAEAAEELSQSIAEIAEQVAMSNAVAANATSEAQGVNSRVNGFAGAAVKISTIQKETQQTVGAIQGIGTTISSMDGITTAIAAAVEEQGAATQEIARNIDHAASGTNQVYENIAEVSRTIHETDDAAKLVLKAVEDLQAQAGILRSEVAGFLAGIREA